MENRRIVKVKDSKSVDTNLEITSKNFEKKAEMGEKHLPLQ